MESSIPWGKIMEKLDGRDIMSLALCNKSFLSIAMEEYTWKTRCLRELGCNAPSNKPQFGWLDIYKSIIDGSHTYSSRQSDKHIDWMRIGAFSVTSGRVVATDTLQKAAGFQREGDSECNEDCGLMASWTIDGVQNGIWIADLHLVRCPVCSLKTCEGTMQTLDARHYELFLHDEWKCGEWKYEQLASHEAPFHCPQAAGGLLDAGTIGRQELKDILNTSKWVAPNGDWQPRSIARSHAVAASTNLQPNEGLKVRCEVLKGTGGRISGLRVSQQLL